MANQQTEQEANNGHSRINNIKFNSDKIKQIQEGINNNEETNIYNEKNKFELNLSFNKDEEIKYGSRIKALFNNAIEDIINSSNSETEEENNNNFIHVKKPPTMKKKYRYGVLINDISHNNDISPRDFKEISSESVINKQNVSKNKIKKDKYNSNMTMDDLVLNATTTEGKYDNYIPDIQNGVQYDNYELAIDDMDDKNKILFRWCDNLPIWFIFNNTKNFFKSLRTLQKNKRFFHEVLVEGKPQKMYCDIDGDGIKISKEEVLTNFHIVMDEMFKKFNLGIFNTENISLCMSKGKKISFHWIYHDKCVFKNNQQQKRFWLYVHDYINKNMKSLCYKYVSKKGKVFDRNIVDVQCYNKNHTMRTILSSK